MNTSQFLDTICEALAREPGTLSLNDTTDTVEEWDSVGQLSIIATIDAELHVPVDSEEMQSFTSLRQLVDILKARGALEE